MFDPLRFITIYSNTTDSMALPLLIIPTPQSQSPYLFFSLTENNTFKKSNDDVHVDQETECIGSSHGWLAFDHKNANINPYLRSPFSKTLIHLPSKHTLPRIIDHQLHSRIDKIVLCGSPSDGNNYTVIAMHTIFDMHKVSFRTSIAFCRPGDAKWVDLGSELTTCEDVVCCDATKTAYMLGPSTTVEAWDMKGPVPSRKMVIHIGCPTKLARVEREIFPRDLYSTQWYLGLSELGQLFFVVRYIGNFVRPCDGKAVYEWDMLTEESSEPLVCPYKTVGFVVFKYDGDGKKWMEVDGLGDDCAMFLGGSQSMMVSTKDKGVKGNAIYFTDHYWDDMYNDYSYGGHDMGIFNMADGSIETLLGCEEPRIVPPPFWITVPNV